MSSRSSDADALYARIRDANRIVPFTGAGISTESGIPDYRSPGGLWTKYAPIRFEDFLASSDMRREAWRRIFALQDTFGNARPGRGHAAIAHLVAIGKAEAVITQNIDGLHQEAGVPEDQVIELHGTARRASCLGCGAPYTLDWVRTRFEATGDAPDCETCMAPVKLATVAFGQTLPEAAIRRAEHHALDADLFLVVGSSLVVRPAAELPALARNKGASLVIINREPTPLHFMADLVIDADIGEVLEPLLRLA